MRILNGYSNLFKYANKFVIQWLDTPGISRISYDCIYLICKGSGKHRDVIDSRNLDVLERSAHSFKSAAADRDYASIFHIRENLTDNVYLYIHPMYVDRDSSLDILMRFNVVD